MMRVHLRNTVRTRSRTTTKVTYQERLYRPTRPLLHKLTRSSKVYIPRFSCEDNEFLVVDRWVKSEVLKKHQGNFISGLNLTGQV